MEKNMRILKNTSLILCFTVACLGTTSPAFAVETNLQIEIDNLKTQVSAQHTEITTLQTEITTLEAEIQHQVVQDPVPGECGSVNGQTLFNTIPSTNLCLIGTASKVVAPSATMGHPPRVVYTWTCAGLAGGSTASCVAYDQTNAVDPPHP
jgi:hypothetical protein